MNNDEPICQGKCTLQFDDVCKGCGRRAKIFDLAEVSDEVIITVTVRKRGDYENSYAHETSVSTLLLSKVDERKVISENAFRSYWLIKKEMETTEKAIKRLSKLSTEQPEAS